MHFDDDDHMCVGELQIFNMNMQIDYFCAMSFEIFFIKTGNFSWRNVGPRVAANELIVAANMLVDSARKIRRKPSLCTIRLSN